MTHKTENKNLYSRPEGVNESGGFVALKLGAAMMALGATAASAGTLEDVRNAGVLRCGVGNNLAGFSNPDENGIWQGLDVDTCRAVAAAVFGDAQKIEIVPVTSTNRFPFLTAGDYDLLSRTTTWTQSRDAALGVEFAGVNYYDGQAFLVSSEVDISSVLELDGATICVQPTTTTALNLADFFSANGMTYEAVPVQGQPEARAQFYAGGCNVYTSDGSTLASFRSTLEDPSTAFMLPEVISKEPLGPVVRDDDSQWEDIVRWSLNAMITAEELGVTSENAADFLATPSNNPEVNRLLGTDGNLGETLGLSRDWAANIILQVGNYGEVYERTVGPNTALGLARGLNAQWTDGGIMYSPPFR